ncbi:MAG: nucleoside recognition domain-containing protein, partial [Desulfocapsaceae bacterium]
FMTIFMAPFMSCGARLPVYALFCAALFGAYSGVAVFLIYLIGLFMAILTGYFLKNTLFRGTPSNFVMDLPLYHTPRLSAVFKNAWLRLRSFIKRAGIIVVSAVFVLSVLNSIGYDKGKVTFGNEDSASSILAYVGKTASPVFEPMGISEENWPASVALFTGLFAKEAIVGTINALYAANDMNEQSTAVGEEASTLDVGGAVTEAFTSVGEGLASIIGSLDLLGLGLVAEDQATISEEIGADTSVYKHIAANFTVFSAFAYLLFVLMYFPCLAVIGAARQEMGGYYAVVMAVYSTLLAWSVATFFYQVTEGHNLFLIFVSLLVLVGIYGWLHMLGKKEQTEVPMVVPPPVIKNC